MSVPLYGAFPLPASLIAGLHLSYSGFPEPDREHVVRFCQALGLSHEGGLRKGITTHLVIPHAQYNSQRLDAAQRWGVTAVVPDWLRGLAVRGLEVQQAERARATAPERQVDLAEDPGFVVDLDGCGDDDGGAGQSSAGTEQNQEDAGPLTGCRIAIHRELEVSTFHRAFARAHTRDALLSPLN